MIIDSEEIHHRKQRGYSVNLGVALNEKIQWIAPTIEIKKMIKDEGYQDLMKGSGDVTAVLRIAIYLSRQENLELAIDKILKL